jgi:hypothetical protein
MGLRQQEAHCISRLSYDTNHVREAKDVHDPRR